MNQAAARLRVWERLRTTVSNDVALGDWVLDEIDDEADQRRMLKACKQVAATINRKVAKMRERSRK